MQQVHWSYSSFALCLLGEEVRIFRLQFSVHLVAEASEVLVIYVQEIAESVGIKYTTQTHIKIQIYLRMVVA